MNPFADILLKKGLITPDAAEKLDAEPAQRKFPCRGCGADIGKSVWACDACVLKESGSRIDTVLAPARESIPEKFRKARFDSLDMRMWVKCSPAGLGSARAALSGSIPIVTILGPAGSGKTTLACAMLSEIIEAATGPKLDAKTLDRARRAMFLDALQLSLARQEHRLGAGAPVDVKRAENASVLVVDEFGRDDRKAVDVWGIIHRREAQQKLTIIATWLDQADVAAAYDGGVARRVFEKARVIRLGNQP